jgi:hypothetical protein
VGSGSVELEFGVEVSIDSDSGAQRQRELAVSIFLATGVAARIHHGCDNARVAVGSLLGTRGDARLALKVRKPLDLGHLAADCRFAYL